MKSQAIVVIAAVAAAMVPLPASADYLGWHSGISTRGEVGEGGSFQFGAYTYTHDGYDGQPPRQGLQGLQGAFVHGYRENGYRGWTGPTGFYWEDYEAPIPPGESKTWWDIYLWAQGYTPSSQTNTVWVRYTLYQLAPRALLVLEYVPESIGWTGPMQYEIDLSQDTALQLPIATVTDPLQGTRMHITVFAAPEPSALAVLGLGLFGVGWRLRRR